MTQNEGGAQKPFHVGERGDPVEIGVDIRVVRVGLPLEIHGVVEAGDDDAVFPEGTESRITDRTSGRRS